MKDDGGYSIGSYQQGVYLPPGFTPAQQKHDRPRELVVSLGVAAAAATVAVLVAICGYIGYSDQRDEADALQAVESLRDEAQQAACAYVKVLGTYDFEHFDDYRRKVLNGATGTFKSTFSKTSSTKESYVATNRIKSQVQSAHCGIESGDATQMQVVAQATTVISNNSHPQPQSSQVSMMLTLDNVDGRWVTGKVEGPTNWS